MSSSSTGSRWRRHPTGYGSVGACSRPSLKRSLSSGFRPCGRSSPCSGVLGAGAAWRSTSRARRGVNKGHGRAGLPGRSYRSGPTSLADGLLWSLLSIRGPVVTAPPRRARWKAPLSYHFLAAGHDGALAAAVTGRVRKVTTWVPLEKIQSIRRVQGPAQRALGLVSVHADAAGRHVRAEFRDRDATEADGLFEDLVLAARSQRRLVSGRSPLSAASSGTASPGPGPSGPAVTATRQAGQPPPPPA